MIKDNTTAILYKEFCTAEGNQHIASEYAIKKINWLIRKFRINKILEVGLGIGSISGIILTVNRNRNLQYTGTEANEFCLNALDLNLKENYNKLKIVSDLTAIPPQKKFDLIIIDGKDQNLTAVKDLISQNGIIAIEGDRGTQLDSLQEFFPDHKYVHLISSTKNKFYSPFPTTHWQGGLKLIFINPTNYQKLWWAKEKLSTMMKYNLFR